MTQAGRSGYTATLDRSCRGEVDHIREQVFPATDHPAGKRGGGRGDAGVGGRGHQQPRREGEFLVNFEEGGAECWREGFRSGDRAVFVPAVACGAERQAAAPARGLARAVKGIQGELSCRNNGRQPGYLSIPSWNWRQRADAAPEIKVATVFRLARRRDATPVHAADPDGDRRPEVIQPERDRHN
jgi:hypothetical protein